MTTSTTKYTYSFLPITNDIFRRTAAELERETNGQAVSIHLDDDSNVIVTSHGYQTKESMYEIPSWTYRPDEFRKKVRGFVEGHRVLKNIDAVAAALNSIPPVPPKPAPKRYTRTATTTVFQQASKFVRLNGILAAKYATAVQITEFSGSETIIRSHGFETVLPNTDLPTIEHSPVYFERDVTDIVNTHLGFQTALKNKGVIGSNMTEIRKEKATLEDNIEKLLRDFRVKHKLSAASCEVKGSDYGIQIDIKL